MMLTTPDGATTEHGLQAIRQTTEQKKIAKNAVAGWFKDGLSVQHMENAILEILHEKGRFAAVGFARELFKCNIVTATKHIQRLERAVTMH